MLLCIMRGGEIELWRGVGNVDDQLFFNYKITEKKNLTNFCACAQGEKRKKGRKEEFQKNKTNKKRNPLKSRRLSLLKQRKGKPE